MRRIRIAVHIFYAAKQPVKYILNELIEIIKDLMTEH